MTGRPIFLLLEDSETDALLVQRAFQKGNLLNPLITVQSAEEGMAYLMGVGGYADRQQFPMPALILLDLKLPGADGFDFLRWLRQQPLLQTIRVVVLTASDRVRDIDRAYKLGANSYLMKPLDFERFVEISLALNGYWLWLNQRPEEPSSSAELQAAQTRVAISPQSAPQVQADSLKASAAPGRAEGRTG